jgi:hypothetical protein
MFNLPLQSFQPNDLPVFHTGSDRHSVRSTDRTDGTTSFFQTLERASARETRMDEQGHDDPGQRTVVEPNRAARERENEQQTAPSAPVRERRTENERQTDQDPAASEAATQATTKANAEDATQSADTGAGSATQQASAVTNPSAKQAPEKKIEATISWTSSGGDVKVSIQGLPAELLTALLSALGSGSGMVQAVAPVATKLTPGSALDITDPGSVPEGKEKLTVKLALDPADVLKGTNEIASLVQALTQALQKKVSEMTGLNPKQVPIADVNVTNPFAQLLPKEAPAGGAPTTTTSSQGLTPPVLTPELTQGLASAFKNLVSALRTQDTRTTTHGTAGLDSLTPVPNGAPEIKLPQGMDLTESLFSKVKISVSLPGALEGAAATADKGVGLSSEGDGKSGFGEQGATMQTGMQRQEPLAQASTTTSFGSIVADRLAAVAEQVGLREKPLDITLRLKMEGGESLLVGFKDQAGKIIIQVRCADQNMVNLLESQKETIVRNLEAKQISSTISVSPIEEDLTKRQGREQPKNMWGRRREPSNPNIETSI